LFRKKEIFGSGLLFLIKFKLKRRKKKNLYKSIKNSQENSKETMKKKCQIFDKKFEFINKRFPEFFRETFEAERDLIYKLLITQIQDSEIKGDYQAFYTAIGPIVEKINKVYGLNLEQREFLAAIFYRLAFEEENIFSLERIVFLSNLPAIEKGKSRMKNFQLNWKAFYEFIQRFYLSNERISFLSSHQSMAQYNSIVKVVRRNRVYFKDDNIFDLLEIYREKGHPYEKFTGLLYFHLFSKFTKKTPPEVYEKLLQEFIRIANYLDPIYLDLFAKILRFFFFLLFFYVFLLFY